MTLNNSERLYLLKLINSELRKSTVGNRYSVSRYTMLYELQKKLSNQKVTA